MDSARSRVIFNDLIAIMYVSLSGGYLFLIDVIELILH